MAIARKTYTSNGTFTAPGGVNFVRLIATYPAAPVSMGLSAALVGNDGFTYAWGSNSSGGTGNGVAAGTVSSYSSPVAVLNSNALNFTQVYANATLEYSLGLTANGDCYAWGANTFGQLGVGDVTPRSSPVLVLGGVRFASVTQAYGLSGVGFNIGLTPQGVAYSWGSNRQGALGNGTTVGLNAGTSSPVAVLGGLSFKQVVAQNTGLSGGFCFGLTPSGAAYAWGDNAYGQLGVGDTVARSSPVAVLGGLTFQSISIDRSSSAVLGLTTSGVLYSWGTSGAGVLGQGATQTASSPVAVLGGLSFKQIVNGSNFVLGLTTSGAAYAWGTNASGQVGDGTTVGKSSPVAVLGGLSFASIGISNQDGSTTSVSTPFGLTSSGTLYAWGYNLSGQIGDGTTVGKSSPVAVLGGLSFSQIINSYSYSAGQTSAAVANGVLYTWGFNSLGISGQGTIAAVSSPIAVLGYRAPQFSQPQNIKILQVVPGTSYTVNLGGPVALFGSTPIGSIATQIVVEYEQ